MSISSWLKGCSGSASTRTTSTTKSALTWRSRPTSSMADGADRQSAQLRVAEGFRQRHADHRSGPPRLDAVVARGPARSDERRPLRDPRAREEPGLLAHRGRRAHARHRPERRRLHDAQGPRAQPARGRRAVGALAVIFGETSTGRQLALSYPDYQYLRDHDRAFSGLFGSCPFDRTAWAEAEAPARSGASSSPGTTSRSSAFAPSAAARCCRRTKSRPAAIRSSCSATVCGGATSAPIRTIVGKTIEINNYPLTVVGVADPAFHGTTVVYDVEVFIPVMMAPELGFKFGSQQTTPSEILSDRRAALFYPQGYLRPGTTIASAAAQADALWATLSRDRPLADAAQPLRVVPFWQTPDGAPTILLPTLDRPERDGSAGPVDRLREHRGARAGARRVATRRNRAAAGARRDADADRPAADCREPRPRRARRRARRRCSRGEAIPLLVGYAERLAAPQRLFFNIGVDRLVIGFAALVACGSALVFGFVPALQSSRVDLVSVINEDASPRGAARGRLRAGLVVAQVAVSLLLLVGAGLATRSLEAARRAYPGFDASHVTAIALDVKQNGYDESRGRVFYRHLLDAARADAGIESATLAAYKPLGFLDTPSQRVAIEGYEPRRGEDLSFMSNTVGPDYFRTLRIPLWPAASSRTGTTRRRTGGGGQQHARATILGRRGERDWQADPSRRWRLAHGDRRRRGREVRRGSTKRRGRTSTCRSCSRTARA